MGNARVAADNIGAGNIGAGNDGSVIFVGFTPAGLRGLGQYLPDGGIIELIGIASGYDANGAFLDMMLDRDPAPQPAADRYAATWMAGLPQAGEVESVDGREDALAVPGVHSCWIRVKAGDQVTPLRSSFDRVLAVRAEGDTP